MVSRAKQRRILSGIGLLGLVILLGISILGNDRRQYRRIPSRDYQIDVDRDSIQVWDGARYVGGVPWTDGKIDSLILNDNK